MTRIFHGIFLGKMDPLSGFNIRLVFTLPPRDSTLQYKRCVHLWINFFCTITLIGVTLYTHMSEVFTTKPQRIHFSPEVLFFQLQNPALPFLLRQLQPTISCLHSSQKLKYTLLNINKVILFPEVGFKKSKTQRPNLKNLSCGANMVGFT